MAQINFSPLFQTSLQNYKFFLLFGNDPFLMERAAIFLQKSLHASLETRSEAEFLNFPVPQASLFEAPTLSKLTLIPESTDKILPYLQQPFDQPVIFTSTKARAQSKLVNFFTSSPYSLAVACYPCPLSMAELNFMSEGLALSPAFKDKLFLAHHTNREGLLSLLEKIKLFGEVPDTQQDLFLEAGESSDDFTPLRNAFLLKDKEQIMRSFSTFPSLPLVPFLRNLVRAFLSLLELVSVQRVVWKNLTFPVFFKDQALFESARSSWSSAQILLFLENLLHIEEKVKKFSFSSSQVCECLIRKGF